VVSHPGRRLMAAKLQIGQTIPQTSFDKYVVGTGNLQCHMWHDENGTV
jgi:hypothetical protein